MKHNLRLAVVPAYLLLCLILGGASAAGIWANMALQLLAIPIIAWALLARRATPMASAGRQLIVVTLLMLLVIVIQLIPLPPGLWTALPGRESIVEGYRLLGLPLPWLPISLAPHETVTSALWLLPALAVLFGIVKLGGFKAKWLGWVLVVIAAISVLLGALQLVGGRQSITYFYDITNYGGTVGFFANSNHMATLLVATIPFLTALYLGSRRKRRSTQRASGLLVILAGSLGVVIVGIAINTSLAGWALAVPATAASLLMLRPAKKKLPRWGAPLVAILALAAVYAAFSAPFGNNITVSAAQESPESRYSSFTNSIEAAGDFMPLGSGIGTFVTLYPRYEEPTTITRVYVNHVHSDYIELALETGVLGLGVILVFLLWWLRRTVAIWRADEPDQFARAATIASAAILAHSAVDYPLRTAAISALFAACCALMAEPRPKVRKVATRPEDKARHLSAD